MNLNIRPLVQDKTLSWIKDNTSNLIRLKHLVKYSNSTIHLTKF